ncbi:MAG TPA: VanW family protein [Clostridiales bacterium]|nr:VanW family protein [Clostridiales bacterium]
MDDKAMKSRIMKKKWLLVIYIILFASILAGTVSCREKFSGKNKDIEQIDHSEPRVKENVYLQGENIGGLTRSEALRIINEKALKVEKSPENAAIDNATWNIVPEMSGLKVNIEETLQDALNAHENEEVKLKVYESIPETTKNSIEKNIVKIAEYTTPIVDNTDSRMKNIWLAADKINNLVLAQGEEFSFNRVVGNRTEEKGYEYAPIIIKTEEGPKKEDGIGGGVCQLSTTIYNAVEECGLEITERHTHSSEVTYVTPGEDAAVSYGSIDFKFKNNRSYPIMLKINISPKALTVKVLENRN